MKRLHFVPVFFCILFSFSQGQNISYPWHLMREQSEGLYDALQNKKVLAGAATTAAVGMGFAAGRVQPAEQIPMQAFTPVENEILEAGEEAALATSGAGELFVMITISSALITTSIATIAATTYKRTHLPDLIDVKYFIWKSSGQEVCNGTEKVRKSEVSNWDHLKEKCLLQPGDSYFIRITDLNGKKVFTPTTKILID